MSREQIERVDMARRIASVILGKTNPLLTADCLALITHMSPTITQSDIARKHTLTRAAVWARCKDIAEKLEIPEIKQ